MRFYGIRSGRNNMSRLIARSVMYNTPKKNNVVNSTKTQNDEESFYGAFVAMAFSALICGGLYALLFH